MPSNRMSMGPTMLTPGTRSVLAALALVITLIAGAASQIELRPLDAASAERISAREDGDRKVVEPSRTPVVRSEGRPSYGLRGKTPGQDEHHAVAAEPAQVTLIAWASPRHRRVAATPSAYLLLRTHNPRAPPSA